ncbi:OadG family protein [Marinobacterium litorale]|uniref:OadG family protein n=1 Tax=Marinobacterium litorale TaxID=404770 RepID=UPI0004131A88|nr:OadG family protein [Marinobacterium litorale]
MDNLLSEGLTLMVFGMGFVFVFLTLLVITTSLMSKLATKYAPAPAVKVSPKRSTPSTGGAAQAGANNDELIAVMTAAIHKYRS